MRQTQIVIKIIPSVTPSRRVTGCIKRNPPGIKLLPSVFVFFLMASCSFQQAQEGVKTESDIDINIPVILNQKNPEPPPGAPPEITLKEELHLGYEKRKKGHFPSKVGSAAVDDEGNVFVFDIEEKKVKAFDRNGQLIRSFGKFVKTMGHMQIVENKTIVVYDWGDKHIYYYTKEGECFREINIEKYSTVLNPLIDSKGNIIAQFINYKGRPRMGDTEIDHIFGLRKMDPNFYPIFTIASFEWTQTYGIAIINAPHFVYKVRKDDSVVWGIISVDSAYEFYITNPEGKIIKKIVKEYDPEKITKEDKMGDTRYFPENFPPYAWMARDAESEIYIQTYEKDKNGYVFWDVFDSEGKYIAKFSLPKDERIIGIKKDSIYTLFDKYRESPYVKKYRVIWE